MKERFEALMAECPLVAILRGITNQEVPAVCDVLYKNGIKLLEIPLNSPNALESISIAVKHCGDRLSWPLRPPWYRLWDKMFQSSRIQRRYNLLRLWWQL